MANTIANGRDDNGDPLEAGFYVVYCAGASGAIQCGEIAEYDGETFWGESGEPIDADYALCVDKMSDLGL